MTTTQASALLEEQTRFVDETLTEVEELLRELDDADIHRADPNGGWTTAIIVTHMCIGGLLWVGDVQRLAADPDLNFFFREEIGHDAVGAIPPTAAEAADKIASLRRTLVTTMPAHTEEILAREVEIPTLGGQTVADWLPVITGHLAHHRDQLHAVLKARGTLPARFDRPEEG